MRSLQTIIASTGVAQKILPAANNPNTVYPFQWVTFQNNASHSMRIGDSSVSATKGVLLAAGTPGGSLTIAPGHQYTTGLDEFYVEGTAGDVLDVMIVE
jgi:hypothetical protein